MVRSGQIINHIIITGLTQKIIPLNPRILPYNHYGVICYVQFCQSVGQTTAKISYNSYGSREIPVDNCVGETLPRIQEQKIAVLLDQPLQKWLQ